MNPLYEDTGYAHECGFTDLEAWATLPRWQRQLRASYILARNTLQRMEYEDTKPRPKGGS